LQRELEDIFTSGPGQGRRINEGASARTPGCRLRARGICQTRSSRPDRWGEAVKRKERHAAGPVDHRIWPWSIGLLSELPHGGLRAGYGPCQSAPGFAPDGRATDLEAGRRRAVAES